MGAVGIEYSFTIELPDEGRHGFKVPENLIKTYYNDVAIITSAMADAIPA